MREVNFEKKFGTSHGEMAVSCTTQECDNVATTYYPIFALLYIIICQVVAYGRLKTKEHFKLLALKVVVVTYDRW